MLKLKKAIGFDGLPASCDSWLYNTFDKSFYWNWCSSVWMEASKGWPCSNLDSKMIWTITGLYQFYQSCQMLEKAVFHQLHSYLSENSLSCLINWGFVQIIQLSWPLPSLQINLWSYGQRAIDGDSVYWPEKDIPYCSSWWSFKQVVQIWSCTASLVVWELSY